MKAIDKKVLTSPQKRARHGRRFLRVFAVVSVLIIALHIALPYIILKYLNYKMAHMEEYTGHINTLQLNLFTGSYTFGGITLKKKNGVIPVPFIDVNKLKVSIDWNSLLKWKLVAIITVDNFDVNFVKGPTKATTQTKLDKSWVQLANDAVPVDINRLKMTNGEVHYRDFHRFPKIDLFVDKISIVGENLSSVKDSSKVLPATVTLTGNMHGGNLVINSRVDFLSTTPTFDLNAELRNAPLTCFNNFIMAYAKIDVQKGNFNVYAEVAAKDGHIKGYAKPFITNLDVVDDRETKNMPFIEEMRESLIEVLAWVLKDKKRDRLATKVNFEGSITQPHLSIWGVIGEAIINAFMGSLFPTIDNSININNVGVKNNKNFLEKIFDPEKKNKKIKKTSLIKKKKKINPPKKKKVKKISPKKKKVKKSHQIETANK